jgi:hypothetical protein
MLTVSEPAIVAKAKATLDERGGACGAVVSVRRSEPKIFSLKHPGWVDGFKYELASNQPGSVTDHRIFRSKSTHLLTLVC